MGPARDQALASPRTVASHLCSSIGGYRWLGSRAKRLPPGLRLHVLRCLGIRFSNTAHQNCFGSSFVRLSARFHCRSPDLYGRGPTREGGRRRTPEEGNADPLPTIRKLTRLNRALSSIRAAAVYVGSPRIVFAGPGPRFAQRCAAGPVCTCARVYVPRPVARPCPRARPRSVVTVREGWVTPFTPIGNQMSAVRKPGT